MSKATPEMIKQGLVQYIGSMIQSSEYEGKAARQLVAATLAEEALKLAQDSETNSLDIFVAKPVLRASKFILEERLKSIKKIIYLQGLPADTIKDATGKYENIIKILNDLIENSNQ